MESEEKSGWDAALSGKCPCGCGTSGPCNAMHMGLDMSIRARAAERARIVAWLRADLSESVQRAADAVERGEADK